MKAYRELFFSELTEKNFSLNTIQSYRNDLADFLYFLEMQDIESVDLVEPSHVKAYTLRMKEEGLSDSTIYRKSTSIRSFFKFIGTRINDFNDPTSKIERPKIRRMDPDYLSRESMSQVIDYIDLDTFIGQRDRLILEVLYGTGIKVSELIQLEVDDFDAKALQLKVKNRMIQVPKILASLIINYLSHIRPHFDKNVSQRLFLNYKGYQISRQGIWKNIRKYSEMADISPAITPHMLRNSFAINRIQGGAGLTELQREMGYRKLDSTRFFATTNIEEV